MSTLDRAQMFLPEYGWFGIMQGAMRNYRRVILVVVLAAAALRGQTGTSTAAHPEATSLLGRGLQSQPDDKGLVAAAEKALAADPKNAKLFSSWRRRKRRSGKRRKRLIPAPVAWLSILRTPTCSRSAAIASCPCVNSLAHATT